jgi:hypothetical protein
VERESLVGSLSSSSTQDNNLSAMSCVSTSYCMATGGYNNGTNLQTLTEKWSGGSWSLVGSANTSSPDQLPRRRELRQ